MHHINFIIKSARLIPMLLLLGSVSAQDDCSSNLSCYNCDSRYVQNCGDPFNKTMDKEDEPPSRECQGCCVKILHRFAHEEWVERTCSEQVLMDFPIYHVCMIEGKGHGFMCFCSTDNCNGEPRTSVSNYINLILSLCLGIIIR